MKLFAYRVAEALRYRREVANQQLVAA
ncbi:hypothetical protein JOF53_008596, partial [Crossiella equi]|nr:hypothetical protein [Crossiella equi]